MSLRAHARVARPAATRQRRIRVALIYQTLLIGEVLGELLGRQERIEVRAILPWNRPDLSEHALLDVLILDASARAAEVLHLLGGVCDRLPRVAALPVGVSEVELIPKLIEAGASGYVLQTATFEVLVETIEAVDRGEPPCSPQVASCVCRRIAELLAHGESSAGGSLEVLTPRELQVAELISRGLSNKEIAKRLGITLPTTKNHVHRLLAKLEVRDRRSAVRSLYERGLLRAPLRWGCAERPATVSG